MKSWKKLLSACLVGMFMTSYCAPAFSTEIFAGGQDGFGAQINDLGGANINYNTGTQAQIGATGNGNVIKWDHLNVGSGNKLDFNFTQSGQVLLNKVNGGVSKFAGTVSPSGENGHMVISNPNGMVFMNGSVVNADAGSATFTTHDVTWDGQKNGQMNTKLNGTKNGITVGGSGNGPVPVFRVANDLNIIAPGIDMSGADLFAGGTVSMYTNDGMIFTAGQTRPGGYTQGTTKANDVVYSKVNADGSVSKYTKNDGSGITLKNVRVAKADQSIATADGKIYLIAGNGMNIENLKAGNIYGLANEGSSITLKDSKVGDSTKSYLQTSGKLTLDNTALSNAELGFSGYYSGTDEKYAPSNDVKIDIQNGSKLEQVNVLTNGVINTANSTINNSNLSTKTDIIAASTPLTNSILNAKRNIDITKSKLTNTNLNAVENISTSASTNLVNVKATAGKSINITGGEISQNSVLTANDININAGTFRNTKLNAANDVNTTSWTYLHDTFVTAENGSITINPGAGIYNSVLNAGKDIAIKEAYLNSVVANAANGDISLIGNSARGVGDKVFNSKTMTIRGGSAENLAVDVSDKLYITGAGIYDGSTVKAGSIDITYGANIQNAEIRAQSDIYVNGDTSTLYINNAIVSAIDGNIDITSTGTGSGLGIDNTILNAGGDINVSKGKYGTALRGIVANADGDVNIAGVKIQGSTFNADKDANITASSTLTDSTVNAKENIITNNSQFETSFLSGTNITMDSTKFNNSGATASGNIDVNTGTGITNSDLFASMELNLNEGSSYSNASLIALGNINSNTIVDNSRMYTASDINQWGGAIRFGEAHADGNINSYDTNIHSTDLFAGYDINLESSNVSDVRATAGRDINVNTNSIVGYSTMDAGNNANLNAANLISTTVNSNGFMNIDNFSKIDGSVLKSGDTMFVGNSTMSNTTASSDAMINLCGVNAENVTLDAKWDLNMSGGDLNNSRADAGLISLRDGAAIKNSILNSVYEIYAVDSNISNGSSINAGEILTIENTKVNDSDLYATYNASVNNSDINNTKLGSGYGVSIDYSTINDSEITSGSAMINNSNLTNVNVNTDNLIHSWGNNIISSALNTGGMLNMYDTLIKDSSASSGYGFLRVEHGSTVDSSHLKSASNIHINDSIVNNSTVEATHMYISGVETNNSNFNSIGDVYFYNGALDNINIGGERAWLNASQVKDSTVLANDLEVMDSTIAGSKFTVNGNIAIGNSTLENIKPLEAGNSISITDSIAKGNLTANAENNIKVDGLNSDSDVKLITNDTIDIKNINAKGTISALNANNIIADTIRGNLVYLGGRTKDKSQQGISIGNSSWYEEWNPMAGSVIANNIEADLDLRLLSTDKVVANGLKSGGDILLRGNNITASNIEVTDQKIKTHYPSSKTTTGLTIGTYDSWASGWGLATNEGKDSNLTLNNVNIADKSGMVHITGFENVNGTDIVTPILVVESAKDVNINNLKVDDIHLSNLYYTLLGKNYFNLENLNGTRISAFTQGRDITVNKSFNPDNFNINLDNNYGYKHNTLILQYLNGDYDKVNARNTNLVPVAYIDNVVLEDGNLKIVNPVPTVPGNPNNGGSATNPAKGTIVGEEHLYKISEEIDTIFRRQFRPRSFAASDEELKKMKEETFINTVNTNNNSIKIMKGFKAY